MTSGQPTGEHGKYCDHCGHRIYLVQNAAGERFYVTLLHGWRHCRARVAASG